MFNFERHFKIYQTLEKAIRDSDVPRFLHLLRTEMDSFCQHKDELRMLYYIALHAPEHIYRPTFLFYKSVIMANADVYQPRLPHLLAALNNHAQFNPNVDKTRIGDIEAMLEALTKASSASA